MACADEKVAGMARQSLPNAMIAVTRCALGMPLCGSETEAASGRIALAEIIDHFG
jgi:hypothetical protein